MQITYDAAKSKFRIDCTFHENSLLNSLPSKRYDRTKRQWVAQNLNRNCAALLQPPLKQFLTKDAMIACQNTLKKTEVKYKPFPRSYPFKTKPRPKQMEALDHAYNLTRNAFFMKQGTGKSKAAIDLSASRVLENKIDVILVICPSNVVEVWTEEQINEHCPLTNFPIYRIESGPKADKLATEFAAENDKYYVVVAIESLRQGEAQGSAWCAMLSLLAGKRYALIIDESHNVKGHKAVQSLNVKRVAESAKYVTIMTGTPDPQGPIDYFMQFEILDPNILGFGDWYAFRNRYCIMGGYENKQILTYTNLEELTALMAPFVYQCGKDTDLPPKSYSKRVLDLSPEQQKAYNDIDKDMKLVLPRTLADIALFVESALVKYSVLQQITGGFINYDDPECPIVVRSRKDGAETIKFQRKAQILVDPAKNPKIKALVEIIRENPDRKLIVWARYRTEISMIAAVLREEFGDHFVAEYHGGIPKEGGLRVAERHRWQKDKRCRVFLATQSAGREGQTLNESDLVVYFSNTFLLLDREQSEDRNHRIGQKNAVLYIDLVARGTKDTDILSALRNKSDLSSFMAGQLRSAITASGRYL